MIPGVGTESSLQSPLPVRDELYHLNLIPAVTARCGAGCGRVTGLMTRCHTDLLLRILAYIRLQPGHADMSAMFSFHTWKGSGLGKL